MAQEQTPKIVTKKHLAKLERERIQNHWIVIASIAVIVIVVGVLGYGILDQLVLRGMQPVAKVGTENITVNDFATYARFYRWQLIQQYNQTYQLAQMFGTDANYSQYFQSQLSQISDALDSSDTLGQTVLTQLIEDRLVRQEATRRGITVSKEEIDKAIQEAFGYYANGTPTPTVVPTTFPTPTLSPDQLKLVATLTPTVSAADLTATPTQAPTLAPTAASEPSATPTTDPNATPEATATPYTLDGYNKQYGDYVKSLTKNAKITDADLRKIYESNLIRIKVKAALEADLKPEQEEVWARHILVDSEAEAQSVIESLKKGDNFISLAQKVSKDTGTKATGGDLGWFGRGKMVKEFETVAFSLKVGEISQPIKSDYGYHIIQVLGHENRKLDAAGFEDLKTTTFNTWMQGQKDTVKPVQYDAVWKAAVPTEPSLATVLGGQQ